MLTGEKLQACMADKSTKEGDKIDYSFSVWEPLNFCFRGKNFPFKEIDRISQQRLNVCNYMHNFTHSCQ